MQGLNSPPQNQISLQELHSQIHPQPPMLFDSSNSAGVATAGGSHDDFLHQILTSSPSWPQNDHFHGGDDDSKLRHRQFLPSRFDAADSFQPPNQVGDESVQALFNGFAGSEADQQHFHYAHDGSVQSYAVTSHQPPQPSGSAGAPAAQPRQRVRARRGQATDPHSIAERLRRERIAERMKALQEIVPNANKTDKASMLDEIIDYVKFLQLQVKVLSVSRLGGAGAVAPPVADISSAARGGGGEDDELTVTESQVAKLMEKDLGSAMQYLQGKGLCLMPVSLATAISAAAGNNNNNNNRRHNPFPAPPSALTVQDASSVSMP